MMMDRGSPPPARRPRARAGRAIAVGLSLLLVLPGVGVQAKSRAPEAVTERRPYTAEESKRLGDEAQRLAEARQVIWDRKMKAVSGSICTGC